MKGGWVGWMDPMEVRLEEEACWVPTGATSRRVWGWAHVWFSVFALELGGSRCRGHFWHGGRISVMQSVVVRQGVGISEHHELN